MNAKETKLVMLCASGFIALLSAALVFAMRHSNPPSSIQWSSIQSPPAETSEKPTALRSSAKLSNPVSADNSSLSDAAGSKVASVVDIYNFVHHGMTEDEIVEKFGKPYSDETVGRPAFFSNDKASLENDKECIPPGRFDGGDTRLLTYIDDKQSLDIMLMSTYDGEHPRTKIGTAIWVVNQFNFARPASEIINR